MLHHHVILAGSAAGRALRRTLGGWRQNLEELEDQACKLRGQAAELDYTAFPRSVAPLQLPPLSLGLG